jgi:hypothetical protein
MGLEAILLGALAAGSTAFGAKKLVSGGPDVPAPPPVPEKFAEAVPTPEEASEAERRRLRRARGSSTILTGPTGLSTTGPTSAPGLIGRSSVLGG